MIGATKKLLVLFVQIAVRLGWTIELLRQKKKEETHGIQVNDGENHKYYLPIKDFGEIESIQKFLSSIPSIGKFSVLLYGNPDHLQTQSCEVLGIPMKVYYPEKTKAIDWIGYYKEEDVDRMTKEETESILRIMFREEGIERQLKMRMIIDEVVEDFLVGYCEKRRVDGKAIAKFSERKIVGDIRYKVQSVENNFIRRDKCLQELHGRLQSGRRVVVFGSVGVGKSELMRAYVNEHGSEFPNIVWIESKDAENVKEQFKELAFEIIGILRNGTDEKEKSMETVVSDVYRFFQSKKVLFVFDGAEEPASALLPKSLSECNPYFVITSRLSVWGVESVMNLGPFEKEEAERFIPANRYDSILLKCLDYNPFLLTKLKACGTQPTGFELPLLEILANKSCGDSSVKLHFCEDDVSRLKSSMKLLTEAASSFLKELIFLEDTEEINSILRREEKKEAILNLKENSLIELSNGKLILPKAVRSILFFHKW